jgi:hypothetical protein
MDTKEDKSLLDQLDNLPQVSGATKQAREIKVMLPLTHFRSSVPCE